MATSRATPTPTPDATAQLTASSQGEWRSASTFGGVDPRTSFHGISISRCVASPTSAPRAIVMAFQPYFFTSVTTRPLPDHCGAYPSQPARDHLGNIDWAQTSREVPSSQLIRTAARVLVDVEDVTLEH